MVKILIMKTNSFKTILKISIIVGFTVFALAVNGQANSPALTLKDCIKMSFIDNPRLKQAKLETAKSWFRYKEAVSAGLPQINESGSLDDYFNIPVAMVSGDIFGQPGTTLPVKLGTKYNANVGIEAGQMIYNASYFASLRLFKKACEISNLNLEKRKEELAYNIAQIYLFIQITNLQLALLDSNLLAVQKVLEYSKQHYSNGFISKIDFDRVAVTLSNLEAEKENLLSARNQQLNMLKYLVGIEQNQPVSLSENMEIINVPLVLVDSVFTGQIDLKILEQQEELVKLNQKLTSSQYLPSITGYAGYSCQAQREQFDLFENKNNWYKISFVGLKMNIPIFEGNRVKNKIEQNKIELEQAILGQDDLKNELYVNYLNALQKLNSGKLSASKLDGNMKVAGNIFQVTNDQYRQGLKSLTDVLTTQSEFNTSRMLWLQALLQIRLSELEIAKINGSFASLFL